MLEKRRSRRPRTVLGAVAVYNRGLSSVPCNVRDLTDRGAKLAIEAGAPLPDEFQLEIPTKSLSYQASVRSREGRFVGVAFATVSEDPQGRIGQLETENAALRKRLAEALTRLDSAGFGDSASY